MRYGDRQLNKNPWVVLNQQALRFPSERDEEATFGPSRLAEVLLFTLLLTVILLRVHPWNCLIGYDQPKQAYASLEMIQDGHWWYPHLPTGHPATKPPLMGWLSAALYTLSGGWWEGAWRLPSLIAFFSTLILLKRAARSAGGPWSAYAAVGVFSINMFSIRIATLIRTDMLLTLLIFSGGLMIWTRIREREEWNGRSRLLLTCIVLTSCFTKGPVIYVYLLLPLLVWRGLARGRTDTAHAWSGWTPWLVPGVVFLIWILFGCYLDPHFFQRVVLREFGGNFAAVTVEGGGQTFATGRHFGMILTYPLQLLHRLFPWSLALGVWACVDRTGRKRLMADRSSIWLLTWITVSVLLMSLVPNKRADRIFPVVPPLALLFASIFQVASWGEHPARKKRQLTYALTLIAFLLWGFYSAFVVLKDQSNPERNEECARRIFCLDVMAWERSENQKVPLVGPISDREQSLLIYLRRTAWISHEQGAKRLTQGKAILAPLNDFTKVPCSIILPPSDPQRPEASYALGKGVCAP